MFRTMKAILLLSAVLLLGACSHPYEGRYLSSSFPRSQYEGLPLMDTVKIPSDNGNNVSFYYTLTPKGGNKYDVKGTMDAGIRIGSWSDIDVYIMLVERGVIVESVRMNASGNVFENTISFFKEFETDKNFDSVTFSYNIKYFY